METLICLGLPLTNPVLQMKRNSQLFAVDDEINDAAVLIRCSGKQGNPLGKSSKRNNDESDLGSGNMWKPSEGQNIALCGNNGIHEEDEQSKDNEEDNVMEDYSNETGLIHSSREGCFYNSQRLLEEDAAGEKSRNSEIGSENSVSWVRVTRSHEVIAHEMEGGKDGEFEEGRDVCLNSVSTCGGPPPGFEEGH
ncbi:hypothetical protein Dimus_015306 [Dionaea muscipula]